MRFNRKGTSGQWGSTLISIIWFRQCWWEEQARVEALRLLRLSLFNAIFMSHLCACRQLDLCPNFIFEREQTPKSACDSELKDSTHLCQLSVDPVGEGLLLNLLLFHCWGRRICMNAQTDQIKALHHWDGNMLEGWWACWRFLTVLVYVNKCWI